MYVLVIGETSGSYNHFHHNTINLYINTLSKPYTTPQLRRPHINRINEPIRHQRPSLSCVNCCQSLTNSFRETMLE